MYFLPFGVVSMSSSLSTNSHGFFTKNKLCFFSFCIILKSYRILHTFFFSVDLSPQSIFLYGFYFHGVFRRISHYYYFIILHRRVYHGDHFKKCFSADLLLRQYKRIRSTRKKSFSYKDIKSVYTIVIFEHSPKEFHSFTDVYCHYAVQTFDTGLELELLQKYVFITLDI